MPRKRPTRRNRLPAAPVPEARAGESDRISYRELRNTPGRVWERLAQAEVLTLVADGEAKAIVIPVRDGNVTGALEAYHRGRALLALNRVQASARDSGNDTLSLADINRVIREVRHDRYGREGRT